MVSNSALVSTAWLAERLGDPGVIVMDASWYLPQAGRDPKAEYLAGHISGALFYDLDGLSDPDTPLPHMLLPAERFAAAMSRLGVGDDAMVVVYDGSGVNLSAGRAWWSFRVYGHDAVAVLDGGLGLWRAEGRPLESGPVTRPPARFTPRYRPELVRSREAVRAVLADRSAQVVDARSAGRFEGREPEPRPGIPSGHMPGSLNLPFTDLVGPDGRLLDEAALRARLAAAGVDPARPVVASCGSGVTACAVLLALAQLGHPGLALYDGSWTEWRGNADQRMPNEE